MEMAVHANRDRPAWFHVTSGHRTMSITAQMGTAYRNRMMNRFHGPIELKRATASAGDGLDGLRREEHGTEEVVAALEVARRPREPDLAAFHEVRARR